MKFSEKYQKRIASVEDTLKGFAPTEQGYQRSIMEAMNYSYLAGGKRLRPMLMEETFLLFGGNQKVIIEPFMAAIEMIHTYSLVHDDLPAMDNDDYRRGRKTTHVMYGEAMGILAGDALLNYAFETAAKAFQLIPMMDTAKELQTYKKIARALEILSNKAGIAGMIGGQVIDIQGENEAFDRERLDDMYQLKTGALIQASMMIGAVLADANALEVQEIEEIAGDIGLAFQIKDDILDVTSTKQTLGKPICSDEKNHKTTYVTLMSIEQAKKEVANISERAIKKYQELNYQNDFLEALIVNLITRDH